MNTIKEHIATKTITLLLACLLLVPTAVKFAHLFTHHKHDICLGNKKTHLHEINIDCDFYKFKLNHSYTINIFNFEVFSPQEKHQKTIYQPHYLSHFQSFHTSLRGPPVLI